MRHLISQPESLEKGGKQKNRTFESIECIIPLKCLHILVIFLCFTTFSKALYKGSNSTLEESLLVVEAEASERVKVSSKFLRSRFLFK